jgi:hypothetical protein
VAAVLASFNVRMRGALEQKKTQQRWLQQQKSRRGTSRVQGEGSRLKTADGSEGDGQQRSATPSTVGWGNGGGRMATSVPVENLSVEAMEKLSAYAVKQQLLRLEEEHNEIEQQVGMPEKLFFRKILATTI